MLLEGEDLCRRIKKSICPEDAKLVLKVWTGIASPVKHVQEEGHRSAARYFEEQVRIQSECLKVIIVETSELKVRFPRFCAGSKQPAGGINHLDY